MSEPKEGITIDEAIKELKVGVRAAERRTAWKRVDAIQLSIEGLRAWKEERERLEPSEYELLPGETKD